MAEPHNPDPMMDVIRARLSRARRVWRLVDVGGAALRGVAILLFAFLVALAADNLLHLPGKLRAACAVVFAAAAVYLLIVQLFYRLTRRLTDEMVAVHIEGNAPNLDNRLINAVLLRQEKFEDEVTQRMAESQIDEATQSVARVDISASTNRGALRTWAIWSGAAAAVALGYALLFGAQFRNAVQRYAHPTRYIAPLTRTVLNVAPGNADLLQGEPLNVEARIEGMLPETAAIRFDDGQGNASRKPMNFAGAGFAYEFSGIQKNFRYQVAAGDAVSDTFAVTVRTRPTLKGIKVTYSYPEYMGMADRTENSQIGNITAPVGATVRLEATADRPIASAALLLKHLTANAEEPAADEDLAMSIVDGKTACAAFPIRQSGQYQVKVLDEAKIPNQPILSQIVALPDEAPMVRVVDPGKDTVAEPAGRIPVLAEAKDDFALHSLDLYVQRRADKAWEKVRAWSFAQGTREAREGAALDLKELGAASGDVVSYYFQGGDAMPGRESVAGKSRTYQITVLDAAAVKQKAEQQQEALRNAIRRLIAMQKTNLAATDDLRKWAAAEVAEGEKGAKARAPFVQKAVTLVKAEEEIYATAGEAVRSFDSLDSVELLDCLRSVMRREVTRAVEQLEMLKNSADKPRIATVGEAASQTEQQVVTLLERALSDARALAAERLAQEKEREKMAEKAEALDDYKQKAEKLLEKMKEFEADQKEAIKLTKQLQDTPVNDFTKGDEQNLAKAAEIEKKWARYFQETATDLSKLPPQDFSLANQAKEFSEVFSEVQKAAGAAELKSVEIAVPLEQSGLELAKSIETNIEKWLMEVPDRLKWTMEDPIKDADVPLASLPDELEDIIGDLMEQEEDLQEEAADATSGWLDSIDKGVGWGTMDGPISDMSAKGVTGNQLPDSHEVGGRSGEGRTGKSSGQFVEESAQGKGGRETPSRLTQDPMEAGSVKDTAPEPASGSTGGGKLSGVGAEGFHGPLPPAVRQELKRVAARQQDLIDKADRLDYGLKKYNYPRGELPKTIDLMREMKTRIESGDIATAGANEKIVLTKLKEVKDVVSRQKKLVRDNSAALPKEIRDEVANSRHESVPEAYKPLVESYFKALSEAESTK